MRRSRHRRGHLLVLLLLLLAAGCGVVQPYNGPPSYGNFRGTHGA